MILLSFTVRSHRSLRDEVTLDLVHPSLKTLQPRDGDWARVTYPLAGIFGGNATGKSALLDGLRFAIEAVRSSVTAWQSARSMVRDPFLLDDRSRNGSSLYELDFIHDGRRHVYGF